MNTSRTSQKPGSRPARPKSPTVSLVIPAKNEARNLEVVLPELPVVDQVVVVDGHSLDDTVDVARRLVPGAVIVQQTRRGKGNALACGFFVARGDIIVMFDADGSADPAEIPRFVETLLDGADFVKGSRALIGGGSVDITPVRRLGNRALSRTMNVAFHTHFTELCYGYNAFWRDILPELALPDPRVRASRDGDMAWGDGFEIETLLNCRAAAARLRVVEIPSVERRRIFGDSNLSATQDGLRVLRTIGMEWTYGHRPPRRPAAAHDARRAVRTVARILPRPRPAPSTQVLHVAGGAVPAGVTAGATARASVPPPRREVSIVESVVDLRGRAVGTVDRAPSVTRSHPFEG